MRRVNLTKLRRDVEIAAAAQLESRRGPHGRRLTGAMAIVRDHLTKIEALRAAGKSWGSIAAGLAEQGVTQGDNIPITAKRLTALVASVKRQAARRAEKEEWRTQRRDLVTPRSLEPCSSSLKLAPELTRSEPQATPVATMTEEEIRRANFDKHSSLFRKEQS